MACRNFVRRVAEQYRLPHFTPHADLQHLPDAWLPRRRDACACTECGGGMRGLVAGGGLFPPGLAMEQGQTERIRRTAGIRRQPRGMRIAGYQSLSLIDDAGRACAIVFTQGCPFRPYCHNPGLIPTEGTVEIAETEVLRRIDAHRTLLDGVCVTGGEPCVQPDLPRFLRGRSRPAASG